MFVHTGGGGKGIRPNQHNQQQQQQQQQPQQQQQQHHHPTHHQLQQQQQQLQVASVVHHTNQTSSQSSGNSHPHSHQQQPVPQHQQQYQHHQVPLALFSYPLSQIHNTSSAQHQHAGQTSVVNNVGAPQMAPSPPSHTGGNGSIGGGGSGINNISTGNNTNNQNNMGGNRQQGSNCNTIPHYSTGTALMQTTLPPPNNNHFMTSAYHMQLQQPNTAVMVAAQYNSVAAAAAGQQHGNPGGGQAGHALYQTQQQPQPPQTHQQTAALHSQPTLHYFPNPAFSATHAPAQLHHQPQHHQIRNMIAAVTHPRQQYLLPQGNYYALSHASLPPPTRPPSLLTNIHQQSAAAGGGAGSTVHIATQLQNTATRPTGPTTYVPAPFCTPPLQMGTGAALAPQLAAAAGIGPPQLQATYGHMGGIPTSSTSSTSLNIQSTGVLGGGGGGSTSSSTGTEHKGTKPRKHAIPIIHPITKEKVTFDEPKKKSTAVELKPPPEPNAAVEDENSQSKSIEIAATHTETASMNMESDKSITVSVASAPPPASFTPPTAATTTTKAKIDQQMQTDAVKYKPTLQPTISATAVAGSSSTTTPHHSDIQSTQTGESLQTCIEDPDDTDADTNEHELDNEDDMMNDASIEQRTAACIDRELATHFNINSEKIIAKDLEFQTAESDTENTTETEVKSTCQIDNGDEPKNEIQQTEATIQKQDIKQRLDPVYKTISLEKSVEILEVKEVHTKQDDKEIPKENLEICLLNKLAAAPSSSTIIPNELKNIITASDINVTANTAKNKDQTKSFKSNHSAYSSSSGNTKNSKQNLFATHHKQITTYTDSNVSKTNLQQKQISVTQNASTSGNVNAGSINNNNNNANRKNRKVAKRTKENQKKSQQQQQKLHEPSSSASQNQHSSSAASNNNNNNNSNDKTSNNNKNLSLSSTNTATNILLTDIHNANSSSISSSICANLKEENNHHQQQQQSTVRSNNNNSSRSDGGQSKGIHPKMETDNQSKHIKSQEIVNQFLQPTTSDEKSAEKAATDEQQLQFLNSSSSICGDEEERLHLHRQEQLQQEDGLEHEKLIDTKETTTTATISTKGSQNKQQKNTTADTVDCSINVPPHTRGGVSAAIIHSKANKGHHNIAAAGAGTVHKHKGAKQPLIRYSLEELKGLAKSPESRKTPFVPCQKGDCISQLFVSRQQHHHHHQPHHGGSSSGGHNISSMNVNLPQQFQQMNFNASMDFVNGKRRGGHTRKHHDQHQNATANVSASNAGISPGSSVAGVSGSASGAGAQFPRKMEMIHIHLSLHEDIKLSESENAWQPEALRSKSNHASPTAGPNDDIEAVLKKVRGILNKLTPDNFDVLLKTMCSISMNTQEKMQEVMLLIFEKTVSEPNFAPTYAKFCNVLFQEIKPESKKMFNASLIKRIQTEFEVNVNDADAKKLKLQPLVDKMKATTDAKERNELQAEIEDQEYQFRRRAWGTVRFIGEMYKLQSLTGDRVLLCIESLLEHGSEEKLEYMCKLLTTVGHLLEGNGTEHSRNNFRMNKIFRKIQDIINEAKSTAKASSGGKESTSSITNASTGVQTKISSRVRFMMQDVMDLRSRNWDQAATTSHSSPSASVSVTSQQQQQPQHHRRRQQDDKNYQSSASGGNYERGSQRTQSYTNNNQRQPRLMMQQDIRESGSLASGGGGGGGSGNYFMQKPQKSQYLAQQEQQSIDVKKLNFVSRGDDSSQTTTKLGNSTIYMWRLKGRTSTQNSTAGSQQTTNTPSPSIPISQQQNSVGAGGKGQASNSMNTRNSFKRQTSNQFQVLSSSARDSQQQDTLQISSDMERGNLALQPAATCSSTGNDNACDDNDKSIFSSYRPKDNHKLLDHILEEFLDCQSSHSDRWHEEILTTWQSITQKQQIFFMYYLLVDYLHLSNVKALQRSAFASIFTYLLRCGAFDKKVFTRAYEQFAEEFPDLLVDVPNGWNYVFEFLGPILHERLLNFSDIWQPNWRDDRQFTERFVIAFVLHFTKEFGANYIRDLWHKEYKLDRGQLFISDQHEWLEFVNQHQLQFIHSQNEKPQNVLGSSYSSSSSSVEQQVKRLEMLLKAANDCDLAIDYINTNVNINNNFLKNLTQFLCCDYATVTVRTSSSSTATTTTISSSNSSTCSNSSRASTSSKKSSANDLPNNSSTSTTIVNRTHLNVDLFHSCLPLLRLCLDAQEAYEVTCLDAVVDSIQQFYDLSTSNELICGIFDSLYDCEVIAKESFEKWYKQRHQQDANTGETTNKANKNKKPLNAHLQAYMQKLL